MTSITPIQLCVLCHWPIWHPIARYHLDFRFTSLNTQLTSLIVSFKDITTARQRGFWLAVAYFPFLITCFVSANIAGAMIKHSNWRWGSVYTTLSHYCAETDHHGLFCSVGMFGFIMSSCASLLIVSLFVRQRYLVSRTVNTS